MGEAAAQDDQHVDADDGQQDELVNSTGYSETVTTNIASADASDVVVHFLSRGITRLGGFECVASREIPCGALLR